MGARGVVMAALVLLALLVKTTVLPAIEILDARPDVLVILVVTIALMDGPDTGLRLGFGAGLAQDLISGQGALVGLGALVMMGAGYAAGRLKPYLVSAERGAGVVVSGVLAAGFTTCYGLLGRTLDVVSATIPQIVLAAVAVGAYSAAVSPLVLRAVRSVMRQFPSATG